MTAMEREVFGASPYPPASYFVTDLRPWRVVIKAQATPGILPRILEQFAKRSLIPEHVQCRYKKSLKGDQLHLRISITLERSLMDHIRLCWQATPDILKVDLVE